MSCVLETLGRDLTKQGCWFDPCFKQICCPVAGMPVLLDMWSCSQGHSIVPLRAPQEDWVMERQQAACAARQVPQTSPGLGVHLRPAHHSVHQGRFPGAGHPELLRCLPLGRGLLAAGSGSFPGACAPCSPGTTPPLWGAETWRWSLVIVSTASRVCPLCKFLTEKSASPPPQPAGPRSLLESRFGLQWDWGRVAPTEETKPTLKTNIKVVTGASLLPAAQQPAWCTCKCVSLPF